MNEFDVCWTTGNYTDQDCYICPYNEICSAFEEDQEEMGYREIEHDLF